MYPLDLFTLFPPFPRTNMVFVAMSFDERFDSLYDDVFSQAASRVTFDGQPLFTHRVNLAKKGDSIITEILKHVSECRVVLADITTLGWLRNRWLRRVRVVRGANVLYEIGLAHSARLPEEVIVVRGDADELDFDISGVRVHRYPQDPVTAVPFMQQLIEESLQAVNQRRRLPVERAARALTPEAFWLLHTPRDIEHPSIKTMGDALGKSAQVAAVQKLLDDGLIESTLAHVPTNFMERPTWELLKYRVTPFGRATYDFAREQLGFNESFIAWASTPAGQAWFAKVAESVANKPGDSGPAT